MKPDETEPVDAGDETVEVTEVVEETTAEAPESTDSVDESSDESESADDASDSAAEVVGEPARHWAASAVLAVAVGALVAAIVCAGYFGYTGIRAYVVDGDRIQVRDGAIDGAEQAILNTMTIDPASVDEWEKRAHSSLTGDALKQMTDESSKKVIDQIRAAGDKAPKVSVRIVRSAATEVNADERTAKVLVLSESVTSDQPDSVTGLSYLLTMVDEDGVWKASTIVPIEDIGYDPDTATPVPAPEGAEQGGEN